MHNYHEHHTHSHVHADGSVHTHSHEHENGKEIEHEHQHPAADGEKAEVKALLNYMLEHNEHHAEELIELSDRLRDVDLCAEAEMLDLCISHYKKGNEMLEKTLLSIQD